MFSLSFMLRSPRRRYAFMRCPSFCLLVAGRLCVKALCFRPSVLVPVKVAPPKKTASARAAPHPRLVSSNAPLVAIPRDLWRRPGPTEARWRPSPARARMPLFAPATPNLAAAPRPNCMRSRPKVVSFPATRRKRTPWRIGSCSQLARPFHRPEAVPRCLQRVLWLRPRNRPYASVPLRRIRPVVFPCP
jgi:hypothetical protein